MAVTSDTFHGAVIPRPASETAASSSKALCVGLLAQQPAGLRERATGRCSRAGYRTQSGQPGRFR
jgi:hypothetical protein